MHLRLIKGLSYDGVVRASAAHPDVFVDDPEKYTALLESGYFEALPDAHTVTGHLDADFLGEMDEEQLDKLADDMGVDTTGKDKAEVVAAVAEEPVEVPDISKMKLDELKEFAEDNGIDLTGCTTKASILQKIREYEADAAGSGRHHHPGGLMAERPWVTPEELKEYTEFEEVKNRADSKLKIDISRAESWVIDYCNNRFDDPEKYPEIPENVKTAVLLIAEAYAHNAVEQTKVRLKSETFDDYSYTAESSIIDVGKLGVESLLDDYVVVQPLNGVTMRLRSL